MSAVTYEAALASGLSERGAAASQPALSYFAAFSAAMARPWRASAPAEGVINLCVAEDKLSADLVAAKLNELRSLPVTEAQLAYDNMRGTDALRRAFAAYISRVHAKGTACSSDELSVSAGAGAVLENLAMVLGSPGDAILVPAPLYPAFKNDLRVRAGVRVIPVREPGSALMPSTAALQAALDAARHEGVIVCALLVCNPINPTGLVMPAALVAELIGWALGAGLHYISDEIYGASVYAPSDGPPFVSAASIAAAWPSLAPASPVQLQALRDRVHTVLGLSKDFCASGLRCGVLWTKNAALRAAYDNVGYFCALPNPVQAALAALLSDERWLDGFQEARRGRLRAARDALCSSLASAGVPHAPAAAGMFVFLDLSAFCRPDADAAAAAAATDASAASPSASSSAPDRFALSERELWTLLKDAAPGGVLLTPGHDCCAFKPGWFRACFAAAHPDSLPLVGERIAAVLEAARDEHARRAAAAGRIGPHNQS